MLNTLRQSVQSPSPSSNHTDNYKAQYSSTQLTALSLNPETFGLCCDIDTLSSCLDKLAAIKTEMVSLTHLAPWYSPHEMKSSHSASSDLSTKQRRSLHSLVNLFLWPHRLWLPINSSNRVITPSTQHLSPFPLLCVFQLCSLFRLSQFSCVSTIELHGRRWDEILSHYIFSRNCVQFIVRTIAFNSGFHSQHSTQSFLQTLVSTASSEPYHSSLPSGILHHWYCHGKGHIWQTDSSLSLYYLHSHSISRCTPGFSAQPPSIHPSHAFLLVVLGHHILHFCCYADDIQLYISTRSITAEINSALGTMSIKSTIFQASCNRVHTG